MSFGWLVMLIYYMFIFIKLIFKTKKEILIFENDNFQLIVLNAIY